MLIYLNKRDCALAWSEALRVRARHVKPNTVLYSRRFQDADEAEYVGYLGEVAVAKAFGVQYQMVRSYGLNQPDLRIGSLRIQVKSSARVKPRLMVPYDRSQHCDVFVLVAGVDGTNRDNNTVRLVGWISRSAALDARYLTDVPWNPMRHYVVPTADLHPMETLLEEASHEAE